MSRNPINAMFLDHPSSVDETYLEHFRFAGSFAFWLMLAGMAAAVHAVIPCLFETTAGRIIGKMHAKMSNRSPH